MSDILWLTDCHLSATGPVLGHDSERACRDAVDWLSTHYADAACCVVSGDLTEHGTEAEYRLLKSILDTLPMPWLPLVGNHDTRDALEAVLTMPDTARLPGFVQYRVDLDDSDSEQPPVTLLCLDTLVPGEGRGQLCDLRLDWLDHQLRECADRAVLVFMHHPPTAVGVAPFDAIGLDNASALSMVLAGHACVKHLCAGHVHRLFSGDVSGIPFTTQRSVLLQAPAARPAWDWDSFAPAAEPAGFGVISVGASGVCIHHNQFPAAAR